jgi:hypothetical protein
LGQRQSLNAGIKNQKPEKYFPETWEVLPETLRPKGLDIFEIVRRYGLRISLIAVFVEMTKTCTPGMILHAPGWKGPPTY